jgi:hypothetical protein
MSLIREPLQPPIVGNFQRTKTYVKEIKEETPSLNESHALEPSCTGGVPSFHTNTVKKFISVDRKSVHSPAHALADQNDLESALKDAIKKPSRKHGSKHRHALESKHRFFISN